MDTALWTWMAEQFGGIRQDLGELKGRMAALEHRHRRKPMAWLFALARVPWGTVAWVVMGAIALISGHWTAPEIKEWLGLAPKH